MSCHVAFGRPRRSGDVPQSSCRQVETGLTVRAEMAGRKRVQFGYGLNYLIDVEQGMGFRNITSGKRREDAVSIGR